MSFASDNYAGIHPEVLAAIQAANQGHAAAYGNDQYTENAIAKFKEHFGNDSSVHFVLNGTAANVTALAAITHSYEAIICADKAHIQADECGAPEKLLGSKLLLVPTQNGKIAIDDVEKHLHRYNDQHAVQPRVISISQSTEYGTVYTLNEMRTLANYAHQRGMYLHVDGARICNAAASLNVSLSAITKEVGVDVLSFGGTKNGLMLGEAVIFFNPELAKAFPFIRKQNMQLASKMRFIAAQFNALLSNDLWKRNATHANNMAKRLAEKLATIPSIQITHTVDANAIFATMPRKMIDYLQSQFSFYVWDEAIDQIRLMLAYDTSESEIVKLLEAIHHFSLKR